MKKKYIRLIIIALVLALFSSYALVSASEFQKKISSQTVTPYSDSLMFEYDFLGNSSGQEMIAAFPYQYNVNNQNNLLSKSESQGYVNESYLWNQDGGDTVSFTANVSKAGNYVLRVDYLPMMETYESILLDVQVNDQIQKEEHRNVQLPAKYQFSQYQFEVDRSGNDAYPEQVMADVWGTVELKNNKIYNNQLLVVNLHDGENKITFKKNEGRLLLGNIKLFLQQELPNYEAYRQSQPDVPLGKESMILEAEQFYYKNENYITVTESKSTVASPYETYHQRLNVIDPKTFSNNGDQLAYLVDIKESGYYQLGIKGYMAEKPNAPVFIDVEVDQKIPFAEFNKLKLEYSKSLDNYVWEEYPVYLEAGIHQIAYTINSDVYKEINDKLGNVSDAISNLAVNIKKLTGNNQDKNRDWDLSQYVPDLKANLESWKKTLVEINDALAEITEGKNTQETQKIGVAVQQLEQLIANPNAIPSKLSVLSEGSSSILQMLSITQLTISKQYFGLDQIIVCGSDKRLPIVSTDTMYTMTESMKGFVGSFSADNQYSKSPKTIDIWIKRPRQYVDVMQKMIDEQFTPKTGIQVNVSIMTDAGKLTLANAAGKQPDGALGVDSWLVNELALRGSLADLRQFEGVNEVIDNVTPGSLLQMIIDDSLYGLPEAQDFSVLFYRKDIFEKFGFQVPNTWDDVLLMLPELQRYGMNFYTPLSGVDAFKSWPSTAPFLFQYGADIYASDGMTTIIDSNEALQAMQFMTDLFKLYGTPLQVGSFYDGFRYGELPVGISNFSTYVQLAYGAPEIANQWSVALIPGVQQADGSINRWSTGSSFAASIFEASDKKDETWQFVRWWLETSTQEDYTKKLQNMYGPEYLWNSANLNVLEKMPIPKEQIDVIREQLQWLREPAKVPGGYYAEREISNAWNKIVLEGANVRSSLDEAAININRELMRKMEEFGYMVNGEMVKPYEIPTIKKVEGWLKKDD